MRFFSGVRGGGKDGSKRPSPAELYKQKTSGKPVVEKSAADKYKDAMELRMQKMMEDTIAGRKKNTFRVPGTKDDDKPVQLSKKAQDMLKMLAMQKMQKDAKKEKKQRLKMKWEESAKKRAAYFTKVQQDQMEYEKRMNEEAAALAAAAAAAAYNNDNNSGW